MGNCRGAHWLCDERHSSQESNHWWVKAQGENFKLRTGVPWVLALCRLFMTVRSLWIKMFHVEPWNIQRENLFLHLFQIKQSDEPFCVSTNVHIMIEGAALHGYIMDNLLLLQAKSGWKSWSETLEPTMMLKDPMKWYKLRVQFKVYLKL